MNNTTEVSIKDLIHSSIVSGKLSSILSAKGISIVYSEEAKTASINFEAKIITFPMFANMTNTDIHLSMLAHETAHLLLSDMETCLSAHRAGAEHSCHNIVLDIRDERLFKKEYPGFVKYFNKGYESLLQDGFFGKITEIPFNNFPTRLNAFAKLGFPLNSFIPLSESERDFYDRCMLAETNDDINRLSVELFALAHKSHENIRERLKNATEEELAALMNEIMESESLDDDDEPNELNEEQIQALVDILQGNTTPGKYQNDLLEKLIEKLDSDAMQTAFESMKDQLLTGIQTVVYHKRKTPVLMTHKQFLSAKYNRWDSELNIQHAIQSAVAFKAPFQNSVKHMAMMFEARKAAHRMMNRKLDKQGSLDNNRLALYRVSNELFRSRYKEGHQKNHGLIIMLDASGSIQRMFQDMLAQVVTITEFCRSVCIPFKVFMFGAEVRNVETGYDYHGSNKYHHSFANPSANHSPLVECLSSEQSLTDYHTAIYKLKTKRGFDFGSTPTINALANIESVLPKFFANIDQRKLFLVTDGDPTDNPSMFEKQYVYDPELKTGFIAKAGFRFNTVDTMSKIFKQRYNVDVSTLAIASTTPSLRSMAERIVGDIPLNFAANIKEYGVGNYTTKNGNAAMFIRSMGVEGDNYEISVEEGDSVAKIKNKFSKNFGKIRKSKIMLNILVENLAL